MITLDTLKADARAEQRERNRRRWQPEASTYYVPLGASLLPADPALRDNAPALYGDESAADYTGDGWVPVAGGRKRAVTPSC